MNEQPRRKTFFGGCPHDCPDTCAMIYEVEDGRLIEYWRAWFDAAPSRTGRELLERLQAEHPERYPDRLLRTLQRRLKVWRGEMAQTLVFGIAGPPEPGPMPSMVTVPA